MRWQRAIRLFSFSATWRRRTAAGTLVWSATLSDYHTRPFGSPSPAVRISILGWSLLCLCSLIGVLTFCHFRNITFAFLLTLLVLLAKCFVTPCENSAPHVPPPMWLQCYIIAWHCIVAVNLHHSLNHALCHPEFFPQYRCGHPTGHPKLLQLETLLPTSNTWLFFMS